MTRKKRNRIIVVVLIIVISSFLLLPKLIQKFSIEKENNKEVKIFLNENKSVSKIENKEKDSTPTPINEEHYIALLEIPAISLKRGFYSKDSKKNNVDQNIQILKDSDMPDVDKGNTILASHSGNCNVCYFKKLYKLKEKDLIYIYHKDIKFTYQVVKKYQETKDGDIWIKRDNSKTTLTLTTCSQQEKGKQIVIISNLIKKESY